MDAYQRLDSLFAQLTNYERTRTVHTEWSLDNMHALLAAPGGGRPEESGLWVQVGGSKGKGTTALYLESLARGAGLRTGVYLSPHLERVTERVLVDGAEVSPSVLAAALDAVIAVANAQSRSLSFFEAMTAAAVRVFAAEELDVVVLEVGLGGRLDATTAVPVDATLLTLVELEHVDLLGETIEAIAIEKAHIMRPGKPAWFDRESAVADLLAAHAERIGARVPPGVSIADLRDDGAALTGTITDGELRLPFELPGGSRFELPALAMAAICLTRLCRSPELALPLIPVNRPQLPGRFEVVPQPDDWPVILDGAHTPSSLAEVASELRRRYRGMPVALLFAAAHGKAWKDGLRELLPVVDTVHVTALAGTPGVPPIEIVAWLLEHDVSAHEVAGPREGLAALSECAAVRLVVGSFYLVGAARSALQHATDR